MGMKGKWAQGIRPRNFAWIIKDRLAVSERPGGYGANHRRVRRQEEIIWIREQGFTKVISIIPSTHNLHNYTELGVSWIHLPFGAHDDPATILTELFPVLREATAGDGKVLLHGEELGDRIAGTMAGYLVWSGMVPENTKATEVIERILQRRIGPSGRELVTMSAGLPGHHEG